MIVWVILSLMLSQTTGSVLQPQNNVTFEDEARGSYGGGYGSHGYGGGYGYGGDSYGGGSSYGGGHGHGTISMDPVSVLGLLSLGAVILRSILTLLTASARSLDVSDINLPLQLSDIPEAIANWRGMSVDHVVYERSVDDDDGESNPMAPIHHYMSMLRTEKQCIPHFLCEFWKSRSEEEETFLDVVMLTTASWNGWLESAAIYDQTKKSGSATIENHCSRARVKCTKENHHIDFEKNGNF